MLTLRLGDGAGTLLTVQASLQVTNTVQDREPGAFLLCSSVGRMLAFPVCVGGGGTGAHVHKPWRRQPRAGTPNHLPAPCRRHFPSVHAQFPNCEQVALGF